MAIGVIATITIQDGKNAEFEQVFAELEKDVKANEPGVVFYSLHRSKKNPLEYKVLEQYSSQEALALHGKTDYFAAANKKMAGMVAAAPHIEVLDAV